MQVVGNVENSLKRSVLTRIQVKSDFVEIFLHIEIDMVYFHCESIFEMPSLKSQLSIRPPTTG